MSLTQAQIDDILTKDPEPEDRYVAFLLPPGEDAEVVIAIEHLEVFNTFQTISYSGLSWTEQEGRRSFGLNDVMENLYTPAAGFTVRQCLALIAADPFFAIVACPPGDHEP